MKKYNTKPTTDDEIQHYIKKRVSINPNTNCWEWTLRLKPTGYGEIDKSTRAYKHCKASTSHRASFIVFKGHIDPGEVVRHKCNNKVCCNPDHLEPGSVRENTLDRSKPIYLMHTAALEFLLQNLQIKMSEIEQELLKRKNPGT